MAVANNFEVTGLTISPTTAPAGSQVTVTVSINRPAPAGGIVISIIANPSATATVPSTISIPQGATRASFPATLNYVGQPTVARIYANHNSTKHAPINIKVALVQPVPPTLVIPAPVLSGAEVVISPILPLPPSLSVPSTPGNVVAIVNPNQVTVSWNVSNGATSYKLKKATVNGGPYITVALLTTPGYIDTGLINGTTYYYIVVAVNTSGESANSLQVSGTPKVNLPLAPIGVIATAGDSEIALNWSISAEAITYNVKRSIINGGLYITIANIGGTSYIDTTVTNGSTYYYVLTIVNTNGESPNSSQVTGNPRVGAPGAPIGLVTVSGDAQVTLNWTATLTATSYHVKRAVVANGPFVTVASPITNSYADSGLTNGVVYYYVVSALNAGGESANSSQISTTPIVVLPTPTFTDSFSTGSLDTSKWIPSNWGAPGSIAGVNAGSFSSSALDFSQGMLRITLTQTRNPDGSVTSVGGELQSKLVFGYGTYEWIYRIASTASTANGIGAIVSGSDSGGFTFINNSQTEIDFESEGQFPAQLELTNWSTTAHQQYSPVTLPNTSAFHAFKFVWAPGRIDYYVDNNLMSTHTLNVPSVPAFQMLNFWGTNSSSFGGLASVGVTRYFYVQKVSFWAA